MNSIPLNHFQQQLDELKDAGQLRQLREFSDRNGCYVTYNEKQLLNLSSNDYLGLATDKMLLKNFYAQQTDNNIIDLFGMGSSSSRLMTATSKQTNELENIIGKRYGKEALVFNSGYHANIGILSSLCRKLRSGSVAK